MYLRVKKESGLYMERHSQNVPPVHRRFARGTYVIVAKGRKFSSHYRPIVCTGRHLVRLMHGT